MANNILSTYLSHYFEQSRGPFRSLTDLPAQQADKIQAQIREAGTIFASKRTPNYLSIRRDLEQRIRALFIEKGGQPQRSTPHYMILGECEWLRQWYLEGQVIRIPITRFPPGCISFTYGDSFPAMRFQDGRAYRGQVYTLAELPDLVSKFGLPQVWNAEGQHGPERYIEAQVWEDSVINQVLLDRQK